MLAVKNLRQNVLRSVSLFLAMYVLSGTLLCISLLHASSVRSVELSRSRLGADIMVVPSAHSVQAEDVFLVGNAGSFTMKEGSRFQREVLAADGVSAASPQLFVVSAPLPCCSISDTMIVGYDPESDFVISPWIKERTEPHGQRDPGEAVVGADILAGVGGHVKLFGREFFVAAKLERTGMRYLDSGIFIPMAGVRKMIRESRDRAQKTLLIGPDEISSLLIKLRGGANAEKIALLLEHEYPDRKALITSNMLRKTAETLNLPLRGLALMFALQWGASLFLIGVVHKFSVDERRAELGILKALGATDGDIRAVLALEIAILSGAACLGGVISGLFLVQAFAHSAGAFLKIPLVFPGRLAVAALAAGVFAVSVCSGFAASLFSAMRTSKIEPFHLIKGTAEHKGQVR